MGKHNESIEEKLKRLSKLDPDTGCLIWTGARGGGGGGRDYGQIQIPGKGQRSAHVVAWECVHGPRPEGYEIRHTCEDKLCVNVRHLVLFKVSASEDDIKWNLERLKRRIIVNPNTGCWEWQGCKVRGYGHLRVNKHDTYAHCLMWKCTHGETQGLHVLHKCDNRCCINPEHLWLGTNMDNVQDKVNKGRTARKLNAEVVRNIRTSKLSPKELAKKYEVCTSTIRNVLNRRTWKHVK